MVGQAAPVGEAEGLSLWPGDQDPPESPEGLASAVGQEVAGGLAGRGASTESPQGADRDQAALPWLVLETSLAHIQQVHLSASIPRPGSWRLPGGAPGPGWQPVPCSLAPQQRPLPGRNTSGSLQAGL